MKSLSIIIKIGISGCILAGVLLTSGCSWFSKDIEKPAQELIQDGMEAFDSGDYKKAVENFEQFKDWYPFSKYAILAELKIADAHYHLAEYAEAIMAYEEFEQLHPRNEAVPYVIYQIGRCYYDQIDTVDRDQTSAFKAFETFRRLIQQHPKDGYAIKARAHIIACMKSMAGHDLYVGKFYLKNKQYKAARERFLSVIIRFPDVGVHHQALQYIALCEAYLDEKPTPKN